MMVMMVVAAMTVLFVSFDIMRHFRFEFYGYEVLTTHDFSIV